MRDRHDQGTSPPPTRLARRSLFVLMGAAGAAACSSDPSNPIVGPDGATPGDTGADDAAPPADASGDAAPADAAGCGFRGRELVALSEVTVGAMRWVRLNATLNLFIGRDARGLYAMSAICTHTACTLPEPTSVTEMIQCRCHFSRFTPDGVVQPGSQAVRDLNNFEIRLCNNAVWVVLDEANRPIVVPRGTRVAVP